MPHTPLPVEARFTLLRRRLVGHKTRSAARHRLSLATSGQLYFPETGASVYAWVSNLAVGGVGLTLPMVLAEGTELVLHLRSPGGRLVYAWPARVVRAERETDGNWRIGCAFAEKLSPQTLQSLLR